MDKIIVTYRYAGLTDPKLMARYICLEQTVEIPDEAVPSDIRKNIVGEVVGHNQVGVSHLIAIAYRPRLSAFQLPQFLNLLYGNVSIQPNIQVADIQLPDSFLRHFRGPNFGVAGLRKLLGVRGRPFLATAVKPNGETNGYFAKLCGDFARGGGDIVKDDQNLSDKSFAAFKERVARCQDAVEEANAKTRGRTIYCPIVTAPYEEYDRRLALLKKLGIKGALICPALVGFDAMRYAADAYGLVVLAHPSLTGSFLQPGHGIEPRLLLGKLMRLMGADASIFPNYGGRFSFSREECLGIAVELRNKLGRLKPAFPMPAGGMRYENLGDMALDYGPDSIFLIGGALISRPEGVQKATALFLEKIAGR